MQFKLVNTDLLIGIQAPIRFAFRLLQHFNKGTQIVLTNSLYLVLRN